MCRRHPKREGSVIGNHLCCPLRSTISGMLRAQSELYPTDCCDSWCLITATTPSTRASVELRINVNALTWHPSSSPEGYERCILPFNHFITRSDFAKQVIIALRRRSITPQGNGLIRSSDINIAGHVCAVMMQLDVGSSDQRRLPLPPQQGEPSLFRRSTD